MSTTLPDRTNGTTGIVDTPTVAQQKTNFGNLRDFIADLFGTTTTALRTVREAFRAQSSETFDNGALTFSVATSALTINLVTRAGATPSATDPVLIGQRSATAGNGDFNLRAVTAATSLVVSSGSTLGLANADSTPVYVYLIDNAGTLELAISQKWFGPSGIVSTTAEGGAGAADSATVMYSTTARSNVAFRAGWKLKIPQTTSGTYAAVPTEAQPLPFDTPVAVFATQAEVDAATSAAAALHPNHNLLTLATQQASTSGTSIDFTGIPAGTRRVTVMLNGVSTNGTSPPMVQIGDAGGVETSGYLGGVSGISSAVASATHSGGINLMDASGAAVVLYGSITFDLMDAATFTWAARGTVGRTDVAATYVTAGTKSLSAVLDRVRVTTVGGTDTFDAGTINISYER